MSSRKPKVQTDVEAVAVEIERRGIRSACNALIEICEDRSASAQARAASAIAIFRAVGLHDGKRRPAFDDDPVEMTAEQLREGVPLMLAELKRIQAELAERQKAIDAFDEDDDAAGVFA